MTHPLVRPMLRVTAAAGLAVVAVVHWRLAPGRDLIGEVITQGDLFRAQAGAAAVLAVVVLSRPARSVLGAAALLGGASLVAVVVTTYAAVPAIGPFPRVYEPIWYADKLAAAGAAALATGSSWLALVLAGRERARPQPAPASRR